jgi:ATP-dependent DNA helicase RecQ
MADKNYTLSYISELKGCTVEELCQFAKEKKIDLPLDPDYSVSASKLNAIDPQLAFNLKYGKVISASKEKAKDSSEVKHVVVPPEVYHLPKEENEPKLNVLGKIDLSQLNQSIRSNSEGKEDKDSNENESKKNSPQRNIGIIKFFDINKGWGFVISGNKGISNKAEDEGKVFSLHITSKEWHGMLSPKENEWIVFTPKKNIRGLSATNAERLDCNRESLLLAMRYRGKYAKIYGYDSKGDHYDENILCHIIKQMILTRSAVSNTSYRQSVTAYDTSKYKDVIDAFCEYNAERPQKRQEIIINQFFEDKELYNLIFKIFTEGEYLTDDSSRQKAYSLYRRMLLETLFESGKVSDLYVLPESFDYTPHIDKLADLLVKESLSNSIAVLEKWIGEHDISDKLKLDNSAATTIPLRLVLKKVTGNSSWIDDLNVDWTTIRDFIKDHTIQAYSYCKQLFINKDEEFVKDHALVDILDGNTIIRWSNNLMEEKDVPIAFLRTLMEQQVEESLEMWGKYVKSGYDISPSYSVLRKVLSAELTRKNVEGVRAFLNICGEKEISTKDIFGNVDDLSDDIKAELFYLTEDIVFYNAHTKKSTIIEKINNSGIPEVRKFLKFCSKNLTNEELDDTLNKLNNDKLIGALKNMALDDSIQLVKRLPEEKAISIVTNDAIKGSKLFTVYIGVKWETVKGEMPYCVFDIESDGDTIKEFAFYAEDNMRSYTGEDQINSLFRKLKKLPIIVGHNIKLWDLPILKNKGLVLPDSTFIWDTLEIEILLNPCRYAYSLHTEHHAEADTKLTNELFWNQLYRLSTDKQLVEQLRKVLPSNIDSIINSLQVDYYCEYFKSTANLEQQFFQELRPLDDKLIQKLKDIATIPETEDTLLIAPSNLWARLALYIPLSFPGTSVDNSFRSIDVNSLRERPVNDIIKQSILERFCVVSRTPILENLAQYLRVIDKECEKISFTDDELQGYLHHYNSHIDCIDVSSFEDTQVVSKDYKHIYIIGTELEDRIHKCKVCENKTFADLIACGSRLPFTMASTNYAPVKGEEIGKLGISKPELAANIWVEREKNGEFAFYLNYQYQAYRKKFLDHFKNKPHTIKWKFSGKDYGHINLTQVSRNRTSDMVMRVNSSTTQRSKYWLFQMSLLCKIHQANAALPIIYVVNDKKEIEELTKYASSLGFYIPSCGNGFRQLEYIGSRNNGMVIISKQEFVDGVGSYRTDKPFCYVWDNMDIDRYMLMWDKLPFDDDLEEDADDERDDKVHHTTARQCIHAAWPIYEHYCSLIMANSEDTQFYIIDPHFDDYEDIANSCQAQSFKVDLWESDSDYNDALDNSTNYFSDSRGEEENIDTATALELIRKHLIGEHKWKPTQEEVLPFMWEKKGDCLVSMPTGEGKSVCFQGPALYRASITKKLSLVITPLRALMQDQVEDLQKKGFATNVDYLSGDRQRPEVENIYRKLRSGEIALLYITPERFRVKSFMNVLYQRMEMDRGLEYIIFDEAHCISQWGQEFRPDYRNAVITCIELRKQFDFMFALFSATVTTQVESDIRSFLPDIQRLGQTAEDYNPIRQHIGISFTVTEHEDDARIAEIVQFIENKQIDFSLSCMIIFCRTHRQCEETADTLSDLALKSSPNSTLHNCIDKIGFYHAGLDADLRNDVYEQFKRKEGVEPLYILCATKAFGMGMDIPNVHYVVHYSPPAVLEDYLQEVGRAGRDEKKYKLAFDDGKEKIPALCLTSKEDFRKLKELLVKSQMSWSNLTDAKGNIVEYIKRFQTIEQTKTSPIVVPFNVWVKNAEEFNDTTASRLAFHWLEHIGYIKQRYLSQACLDITLNNNDGKSLSLKRNPVYLYIEKNARENAQRSLISMNDMRNSLRMSMPKIMNQIILCMANGLLELNETMNCKLVPRRFCEANFMIKHNRNDFALHIVFEGLRNLLSDCKKGKVRSIGQNERDEIYNHLMDNVVYSDIIEDNKILYMPWKSEADNPPRLAVTKFETFRKNILTRMGAQMFNLLNYLPMVSYKVEKLEDDVICQIKVKNDEWQQYIDNLEKDCLTMIEHVVENADEFRWAELIIKLGWTDKGYRYFEDLLSVLYHLAYVEHTPLVKSGIEVLTTDSTESEISDGLSEDSKMYAFRKEFDNNENIKKVRLSCMDIFTFVGKDDLGSFIQRYFQSKDYDDYLTLAGDYVPEGSDIMSELTEEALKVEESKLENNVEQKNIYEQPTNRNINVLAGPGAGKTHVLTLRCARLIYKEHVDPSHLLVLAYNRAVVVELRNRLNSLFTKLGMSRIAHQLNVYTFHALAKKCMGKKLDTVSTELWEYEFHNYLTKNVRDFKTRFPNIEYVLVDEFQDITTVRLDSLIRIHQLFPNARFFTIGDINQSIYGFDRVPKDNYGRKVFLQPQKYAEVLDPRPYYQKLDNEIHPVQLSMFTNYRSYQKILDKASDFIQEGEMPISASAIMKYEPTDPYVEEYDSIKDKGRIWFNDVVSIVNWAKKENIEAESIRGNEILKRMRHIDTIAIFFRTNNEVYRGYSKIKDIIPEDVRIRIQGESLGELWRERELYFLIDTLNQYGNQKIDLRNNKTANGIKSFLTKKMEESPLWDAYTLDIAYTLVLNYMDSIRSDFASHTWKELADYIVDIAGRDDAGQVYKIYENYRKQRILQDAPLTLVLTTMHKVKGLEFDVVITTPSFASLPLRPHRDYVEGECPNVDDRADMDEERRLMFVAYTRAKKRLIIYKAERERALSQTLIYLAPDYKALRYTEPKPGMDRYYLSYTAQNRIFKSIDSYVLNSIKKDDPIVIKREERDGNYYIVHNGYYIGRLSSKSTIKKRAEEDGKSILKDFFVSNVFVWTYEDTVAYDQANNTNFANIWSEEAKKQGYINIVQIAGFGIPNP